MKSTTFTYVVTPVLTTGTAHEIYLSPSLCFSFDDVIDVVRFRLEMNYAYPLNYFIVHCYDTGSTDFTSLPIDTAYVADFDSFLDNVHSHSDLFD